MVLTGFGRCNERRNGGLKAVYLAVCDHVTTVDYDYTTDSYSAITAAAGSFAAYYSREGEALFTESVEATAAGRVVTHSLTLQLSRMGARSRRAVEELCEGSCQGLVAIVETMCGEKFLVGYSPHFGIERPLRLVRASATSGLSPDERSAEQIMLVSTDTDKARLYTGDIPL